MTKRIAFTCNHGRTQLYRSVADHLEVSGFEVFWVATGSYQIQKILQSISTRRSLNVSYLDNYINDSALRQLEQFSKIKINGIIASDRVLCKKDEGFALGYVSAMFENIRDFFIDNQIEMVFGEMTWAHEMVTAAVCSMINIPYLSPVNVRYPSDRFAFFENVQQNKILSYNNSISIMEGIRLYDEFKVGECSPFYMNRQKKNLLVSFLQHACRCNERDLTMPNITDLIINRLTTKYQSIRSAKLQHIPSGDYVYLPLQCQPESSIDVLAGFNRSQPDFVQNISRGLPYGLKLAVKEHPLCIKGLDLSHIPSVEMVSPYASSAELIKGAKAVVAISGTACYEAGLYGVPAVTFTDLFFNELPMIKRCGSMEEFSHVLAEVMDTCQDETAVTAFLAKLHSTSYPGFAESPYIYADALGEENIGKVIYAFMDIIDGYMSSKSATADSMCSRLI